MWSERRGEREGERRESGGTARVRAGEGDRVSSAQKEKKKKETAKGGGRETHPDHTAEAAGPAQHEIQRQGAETGRK